MNIDREFIKNWKLSFTYLYAVLVGCLLVRGLFMVMDGEAENMTFFSTIYALALLTIGTLIITFFIAFFGMKKSE